MTELAYQTGKLSRQEIAVYFEMGARLAWLELLLNLENEGCLGAGLLMSTPPQNIAFQRFARYHNSQVDDCSSRT